jgi:hypothetical protein
MIPEGTYVAIARTHQWGETKAGTRQIALEFEIVEGDFANRTVPWFGYFSDKTWERTCESLRYCGWKGDDLADLGALDYQVQIVVEHNEYDGKCFPRVAWVNRLGSGHIKLQKPLPQEELRRFAARMRSRAAGIKEVEGLPVDSSNRPDPFDLDRGQASLPEEDELPF